MFELPASVRLSLWLTQAFTYRTDIEDAVASALPDVDHLDGDVARLGLWQDLGERVVCVDLPHLGAFGGLMPGGSPGASAAIEAGECLFVPSLGGLIVPRLEIFGPAGDEGLKLTLESYDSDPVPIHRLTMLMLPEIDRRFRESLLAHVETLETLDVQPFGAATHRRRTDDRLESAQWALPRGIPNRALKIITTAGLVTAAIDEALKVPAGIDAATQRRRDEPLRALLGEAQLAMAQATTYAALDIAGLH